MKMILHLDIDTASKVLLLNCHKLLQKRFNFFIVCNDYEDPVYSQTCLNDQLFKAITCP